jgi:hypothetical protein
MRQQIRRALPCSEHRRKGFPRLGHVNGDLVSSFESITGLSVFHLRHEDGILIRNERSIWQGDVTVETYFNIGLELK